MSSPFKLLKNKRAFTLIEVLVVISIIGILMSILVLNFEESRNRARDNVRKSDLKSVQLALEVYKAQNGKYPDPGCGVAPYGSAGGWAGPGPNSAGWGTSCSTYIVGLAPDYIPALPNDPNQENVDNTGYLYTTNADRSSYKLLSHMAVESLYVNSYADEFARWPKDCGSGIPLQNGVYAVYSAGAECW